MATIYVTRNIPNEGLKLLERAGHTVIVSPHPRVLTKDELIATLHEHRPDALLCLLTDTIDGDVMDAAAPSLKVIANFAVGFNNIDVAAAKTRGLMVTNTPGVLDSAVAEHTVALILALMRRIVEADRFTKAGHYRGWDPFLFLGPEAQGKALGIVGLGRIGLGVAERCAKGLGMRILYNDPKLHQDVEQSLGAEFRSLDDLCREADVISIHVPLTDKTHYLINEERIALMKPTTYLVNTSRGPVVEEEALIDALEEGRLAGAALDVFECEPSITCLPEDHLKIKAMPNVILTPHIASATIETRQAMSRMAAENIIAVLDGKNPPNLVQ